MDSPVNIGIVDVKGDLDVLTASAMRRRLDGMISSGCRRIIMNMADVGYVDSAGMGLILSELRRIRSLGGLLSLINVSAQLYHALSVMRVIDFMPVAREGARREVSALDPSVLPLWRTTFRVREKGLASARDRVSRLLGRLPFSRDEVFDMTLACGEALGNAVDHTCGGGVLATVSAYQDRVTVEVTDCGKGFSLAEDEEPAEMGPAAERGRGIRLMRLLADSVSISPKETGEGTVVRLVKLFSGTLGSESTAAPEPPAAPESPAA